MATKQKKKPLTRRQIEAKANKWRIIASRLYADMYSGVESDAYDYLKKSHDNLCEAFRALEAIR